MATKKNVATPGALVASYNVALNDALDNVKSYDLCKEVKTFLDVPGTEPEIPEVLLGRLLKLRLLALKQDGIDAKNSIKQAKEPEQASAVVETSDTSKHAKAGKKEEKEKDKGKQAPPTKKGKGNAKVAEVPSRPDSASVTVETSKRKIKLRERKNNMETKPTAIGDEPEDGPDAYYILRDLHSPGILSTLMDENETQVNAIFGVQNLDEMPRIESNGIGKDFRLGKHISRHMIALRELSLTAGEESLWKNVAWQIIQTTGTSEAKELFDAIASQVYGLFKEQAVFKTFFPAELGVTIPNYEDSGNSRNELRVLDTVSTVHSAWSVECVMCLLVDIITRSFSTDEESDVDSSNTYDELGQMLMYLNNYTHKFGISHDGRREKDREAARILKFGDCYTSTRLRLESLNLFGVNLPEILQAMLEFHPSLPIKLPKQEAVESGVDHVGNSIGFNAEALLHLRSELADLSKGNGGATVDWSQWRWVEKLDRTSLVQIINSARYERPISHVKAFGFNSKANVVILHGNGNIGEYTTTNEKHIQVKSIFFGKTVNTCYPSNRVSLYQGARENQIIYSAGDQILQYSDSVIVIHPTWGSTINVHGIKSMFIGSDAYCVLNAHGDTITWGGQSVSREGPFLTYTSEDGTVLYVTKGPKGTLATLSLPTGLSVDVRGDGTVAQRVYSTRDSNGFGGQLGSLGKSPEVNRVLMRDGTVIRFLSNDAVEVLYSNGNTSVKQNGQWTSTTMSGNQVITTATGETIPKQPLRSIKETHISLQRVIVMREDSVCLSVHGNGEVFSEHIDRTKIASHFNGNGFALSENPWENRKPVSVTVSSPRFATVSFNKEDEVKIVLPNGACLERKAGGQSNDAGHCVFSFTMESLSLSFSSYGSCTYKPFKTSKEQYNINWVQGNLSVDDDDNTIRIEELKVVEASRKQGSTPKTTKTAAKSKGSLLKQLMESSSSTISNISNPPRVFVVEEDGSGYEILRDEDIWRFLARKTNQSGYEVTEDHNDHDNTARVKIAASLDGLCERDNGTKLVREFTRVR
ncbi:hypothetical protein HDU97_009733 [Phlyctochytrium planicorne]|nr:hypothetical protein HDU97_009733 [Phlyctochytrium planicorne]